MMATSYQQPQYRYSNYESRPDAYSNSYPVAAYVPPYTSTGTTTHSRSYSTMSQPPPSSATSQSTATVLNSRSCYSQPTSPSTLNKPSHQEPSKQMTPKTGSSSAISPNLQIPKSINDSGGSLPDFAAQMTNLLWFESIDNLDRFEKTEPGAVVPRLIDEAIPSSGFRKWVVTILSTTQVTPNVILLALLFIYRLKHLNPAVKGSQGSEYRLLTVALMLGNKFLDDNTYTNKTWAEVTGITVAEIHVMEVEFLSNMRYSLLASAEEWAVWQKKLGRFWLYCDQAGKIPPTQYSPQAVLRLNPSLPSPPESQLSPSPSSLSTYTRNTSQQWSEPQSRASSISRKRSFDGDSMEPTAKRVSRPSIATPIPYSAACQPTRNDGPRLPIPNLTISTSLPSKCGYNGPVNLSQNVPILPPLNGRAMSSVYPPMSQKAWTPQLHRITPTGPSQHGHHNGSGYSTPTRRHSPHSVQELLSLGSSPISGNFPPHNPGHVSPSFFLQLRNSPYKPVRNFDTLLYPPPSASMHGYSTNIEHMHYQPLGKRNDFRSGIVPDYVSQAPVQWNAQFRQPNFRP